MSDPISPPPVRRWQPHFLPAYLSNGVIGLRVPRIPLVDGVAIVSGFAGVHPVDRVESFAQAPYPVAAELTIDDVTLSRLPERAVLDEQAYDFSCGELCTRFHFDAGTARADVEVLTLCSRTQPTVVLQEITLQVDRACDVVLEAAVDPAGIPGGWLARDVEPAEAVDGSLRWHSHGGLCSCGGAYTTELAGAPVAERSTAAGELERLATRHAFRARAGRRYRLRQLTSLVGDALHHEPDRQAMRLVYAASELGFDTLRADNRRAWEDLWRGRVQLIGAPRRWQALADAAFFYLHSSVHPSSPTSTSLFGLSYWPDYHYYRGHVMWDIEAFALPPLLLTYPPAARAMLDFRADRLDAARTNAAMFGYGGAQYPWESSLRRGEEAAPDEGSAAGREHHVSLDVAHAFVQYVRVTGDLEYARHRAWPVVQAVADWIESRVVESRRGFEIRQVTGVAEKERPEDNSAFINIGAITVLREAVELAETVGAVSGAAWPRIARGLVVPIDGRPRRIRNYDGHRRTDEKGDTPDAAAALLCFGYDPGTHVEAATYRDSVDHAGGYVGAPMLSALLGVFAARAGDEARALELFERGYAEFVLEPFAVTVEYSPVVFPERTPAGPFTANLGGFLTGCLYGLTGVQPGAGEPGTWGVKPVALPRGWRAVEVERVWARGREARLVARRGTERATIELA
jgi:hypothetical protein